MATAAESQVVKQQLTQLTLPSGSSPAALHSTRSSLGKNAFIHTEQQLSH